MPKKKSIKKSVENFKGDLRDIRDFVEQAKKGSPPKQFMTYAYELAIIKLYTAFERLMLDAIVGAINNDSTTLSNTTGVDFPKHLTDEVCEFLVVGTGFFDFKGRDGLIRLLRRYVPSDHDLVITVKDDAYKQALERLYALRNFAAHESSVAKRGAKAAVKCKMGSAGSWLKCHGRFEAIADRLERLADNIGSAAPY